MGIPEIMHAPGPKGNILLGSLLPFSKDSLGFLSESLETYGDVVRMRFAHVQTHLINQPDLIESVLLRNANDFDKDTRSVSKIQSTCGNSLLSANEPAWARHRKLIQPVFQYRYLEKAVPEIDPIIEELSIKWTKHAKTQTPVDIVSEMMRVMITISARILFGADVDDEVIETALEVILADTWRRLQAPIDFSDISPALHRPNFKKAKAQIDNIIYEIIKNRRSSGSVRDDVLSRLLIAHEAEADAHLSDEELRDAALTLLLAGHETTANALAWAFISIAVAPQKNYETSDMANVFAETVRLYPSIWIMERRAKNNMTLGGYDIAKGSSVMICPYLLHRDSRYWKNPESFDPTRFETQNIKNRPRSVYLPFGLGKHNCVGQHMSKLVAIRVMENVFARFRLHLAEGQTPSVDPGITLRHKRPVKMMLDLL